MLIIVESPAKAKTISQIVGTAHTVKASVGHIRSLSDKKKTEDGRKLEISGIDIDNDFYPIYDIDEGKIQVVKDLKKLAKAAKDGILFATDPDREGEAISWHLAEVLGIKDLTKIKRLEFHEITKKAILEAINSPRELNFTLVEAQKARQVLDKLVGFKLSPVIWQVIGNRHLSAGRVQTPALALICEREKEILAFVPEEYWEISGIFEENKVEIKSKIIKFDDKSEKLEEEIEELEEKFQFRLVKSKGEPLPKKISTESEVQKLIEGIVKDNKFQIISDKETTENIKPKPPFITSTLQQAASSKLGFTPKMTMQLAQKLYEGIEINGQLTALITYMRTDSLNLSTESIESARNFISSKYPQFLPQTPRFYKTKSRNAQEAHEAIRPVNPLLTPAQLLNKIDNKLFRIYELIWKQMVSSQMTDEVRLRQTFVLENSNKDGFSGSIVNTVSLGFRALYVDSKEKVESSYKLNDYLYLSQLLNEQHFTKPPSRFSPASLIKKLEELGIGRPSTYASIISTLQDREYIEIQKNSIFPTTLGMKVGQLLTDNFRQVTQKELTANLEEELDAISRGEKKYAEVVSEFWNPFKAEVEEKSQKLSNERAKYLTSPTNVKCPECGSEMELKLGRFGEYYQCLSTKEHQFQKNFREYNEAIAKARVEFADQAKDQVCQECGKNLIVRVSKSSLNPYIACSDYMVGNKHTVMPINYGKCPKCEEDGRTGKEQGVLLKKKGRGAKSFVSCSLPPKVCGYIQDTKKEVGSDIVENNNF
jgi:DNA topoisomerase-1